MRPMVHSKRDVVRPFEAEARWHSSGLFGEGMVGGMLKQEAGELHVVIAVERAMERRPPEQCRQRARVGGERAPRRRCQTRDGAASTQAVSAACSSRGRA